jgi:methylated-DNA-protein-cysteine methyltransferase-like protein
MNRDLLYLLPGITWSGANAVATDAGIAPMTTLTFRNQPAMKCRPLQILPERDFKTSKNNCTFSEMKKKDSKKKLPTPGVSGTSRDQDHNPGKGSYSFFTDVYDVVRQVPKGKVTTYGAIAAYLGTKLSARMVGWAMNGAHQVKPKVPAQRVVNRNGMLTGKHHFATATAMENLLKKDGVAVKNDTVVDFEERFWDPSQALAL